MRLAGLPDLLLTSFMAIKCQAAQNFSCDGWATSLEQKRMGGVYVSPTNKERNFVQWLIKKSALLLIFPMCAGTAAENDDALHGCWRSQQVQVTLADGSHRDQNGDCVVEYDATRARSRCHNETGEIETLSSYRLVGPGQLRLTLLDPATGKPKGDAAELRYRIEDEWLLTDRQFPAAATSEGKQPTKLKAVSVRVRDNSNSRCAPRGEQGLRLGRTSRSSLALSVPPGWKPLLVDPVSAKWLGSAIDASLFIGAFVPREPKGSDAYSGHYVLVLDDIRYGPAPIRSNEFTSVKKQFVRDLGTAKLICDQPDRACASLRMSDGGQVYTELFNVNGRVVIVTAAVRRSQADPTNLLHKSVQDFVAQLRSDNTK